MVNHVAIRVPPPATLPSSASSYSRQNVTLSPRGTATARPHAQSERDVRDWALLIRERSREGRFRRALALFREMMMMMLLDRRRRTPDGSSLNAALRCCAVLGAVRSGREVHGYVVRNAGVSVDLRHLESSLVDFYAKCGLISEARVLFDRMPDRDVVAWTIMLMAYSNLDGFEDEMLELFKQMLCSGVPPNPHTLTTVLRRVRLGLGGQLHSRIVKRGWDSDAFVGNALVDMYAKNGVFCSAELAFKMIEEKDVVCFNTLISGYGRIGDAECLVSIFKKMGLSGLAANQSTYVGLLNGCASLGSITLSKQFHARIIVGGFSSDGIVQAVVLDMYAKCGDLEAARTAFDKMGIVGKNVVAWNSMVGGYGKHGYGKEALRVFRLMEMAGVPPDYITFTCLLSACSHSGLVDEGWRLFKLMGKVYGIPARNEHYCCMVDLMGRAGMIREAYDFVCGMKCFVGASVWGALLSACRVWGDVEIAEVAARKLFELEPDCSGSYVALAGTYASNGLLKDAVAIREMMDGCGIKKETGYSWIEFNGEVHKFRAGGTIDHHSMVEINSICKILNKCMSQSPPLEVLVE